MKPIKMELTIGTANHEAQLQRVGRDYVMFTRADIAKRLSDIAGGCSVHEVQGCYIMENGTLVEETSLVFTIILFDNVMQNANRTVIYDFAEAIRSGWGEECVLITETELKGARLLGLG